MQDEYSPDLISLSDEEGNEYNFEVLDAIETDDGRYVALTPAADAEDIMADDGSLIIMKAIEEDGENYFEEIEDDDEYETVADMFVSRLQDFFEIDEQ